MRVLVLGLDGASWNVMKPLMGKGRLSRIRELVEKGVTANLLSTIPLVTGAAWTAMATGRNPGKTGVIDHLKRDSADSYRLRPITSRDLRGKAF